MDEEHRSVERKSLIETRLSVLLAVVVLLALVAGHVAMSDKQGAAAWRELALDVVANLIPVLVVLLLTFTILKVIVEDTRRRELQDLRRELRADTTEQLAGLRSRLAADWAGEADTLTRAVSAELERHLAALEEKTRASVQLDNGTSAALTKGLDPTLSGLSPAQLIDEIEDVVRDVLRVISAAVHRTDDSAMLSLRAFCHIANDERSELNPVVMFSHRQAMDFDAAIPLSWPDAEPFVIARAFNDQEVVVRDLPDEHLRQYPRSLQRKVEPRLRSVMAAPICGFKPSGGSPPIGTISVDSTLTLEELGITRESVSHVLALGAIAVNSLLRSWRNLQLRRGTAP